MKKILAIVLLAMLTTTLAFAITFSDSLEVEVEGTIAFEDLNIKLVEAESGQEVSLIDFNDFEELNTLGFVVAPQTLRIVYNYNKPSSIVNSIVELDVSSLGLTTDGGITYPIKVSLVDPTDIEKDVEWGKIELLPGTAETYKEYGQFKIRLEKVIDYEIPIGSYSGTVSFSLLSV